MAEKDHPTPCLAAAVMSPVASTSKGGNSEARIQRNVAEKQRRDKLNGYISELANIVPMVSMSSKRLDKTSILRLSAAHLRICKSSLGGSRKHKRGFKWCPSFLNEDQVRNILESVDGFLLVTTNTGKVLFTSRSVERYLGHQDIDLIGHSLFTFIHPDDMDSVKDETERVFVAAKENDQSPHRCSFRCRMREKGQPRSEVVTYQYVHFVGAVTSAEEPSDEDASKNVVNYMFKAFIKVVDISPYNQLSLEEATADEYVTRHSLDGTIIFADHRLATITGHMPHEVVGLSAYTYIHAEDTAVALFAHHLMFSNDKGTGMIVYRLRTRNDKFVYLKSVGCLQFDAATSQVDHFVCVNQYLSETDGDLQLKYFVDRFIPHIKGSSTSSLFESVKALQTSSSKSSPGSSSNGKANSPNGKTARSHPENGIGKVRDAGLLKENQQRMGESKVLLEQGGAENFNQSTSNSGVEDDSSLETKPLGKLHYAGASASYTISAADAEFFSKTIHKSTNADVDTIYVSSLDSTLSIYKNSTSSSVKRENCNPQNGRVGTFGSNQSRKISPDMTSESYSSDVQFEEAQSTPLSNIETPKKVPSSERFAFSDSNGGIRNQLDLNQPFPMDYLSEDINHAANHSSFAKSEGLDNSVAVLKNSMWSAEDEDMREGISNSSMDVCEANGAMKDAFAEDFSLLSSSLSQADSNSSANGWNDVFSFPNYQSPLSDEALLPFEEETLSINNPNVKSYDLW